MKHLRLEMYQLYCVMLSACALLLVGMSVSVRAGDSSDATGVQHDLLFVSHGPDGEQIHVSRRTNGNKRTTIYKNKSAYKAIKWAIKRGATTAILKGEYQLSNPIDIRRDRRTIIVPPETTLSHKSPTPKISAVIPLIEVVRADNCRVFTFGLLEQTGTTQEAVLFNGKRDDGKHGINGGLLFGTSEVRNMGSAYIFSGTKNIHVPLAMGSNYGQMLVGCGASWDMTIGTLVGLGTRRGGREGELIDLNSWNKDVWIDRVIGTSPMDGDEIVDFNHGHNLTINRFEVFFGTDRPGRLPVGLDLYGSPGYFAPHRKRFGSQFKESKNVFVKFMERNHKKVAGFNRNVTLPGFPGALPELTVKVHLSVDFEDGTTQTLIDNKRYRYDLSSDLELDPAEVRLIE